jgi:serine phosphatase RsbU (regulator of sigma subunit)
LAPGDLLVLYTDGLIETVDRQGHPFGTARLLKWAQDQRGRSPEDAKSNLAGAVRTFCGNFRQDDDRSIFVVQHKGSDSR